MGTPRNKPKAAATETAPVVAAVTLDQVKEATKNDSFVYTSPEFHAELLSQGLVEINAEMTDADGKIATRATFKDENQVNETQTAETGNAPATAEVKAKQVFDIVDDIPEPVKKTRTGGNLAGRTETYPFSGLELNKGFFVAGKEAKAMASTVASANARFSEIIPGQTKVQTRGKHAGQTVQDMKQLRHFVCFDGERATADGTAVNGVWVKRDL